MTDDVKHLSDDEVIEYWVLRPEDRASSLLEKHRVSCAACDRRVRTALMESADIALAIDMELSVESRADCSVDDVAAYADGSLSADRSAALEAHLLRCNRCLCLLVNRAGNVEPQSWLVHAAEVDGLLNVMKLNRRHKRLSQCIAVLRARHSMEQIAGDVQSLLRQTFSLPTPRFAPVFGGEAPRITGPLGKTRYPILFAWQAVEDADEYVVSIDGCDARFTTGANSIELTPDMLALDAGASYMWQLDVLAGGRNLDRTTGFFSLVTEAEADEISSVENEIKNLEPLEDRYLLIGEILERRELFVDAIMNYKRSNELEPFPGLAYRIAFCYDQLQLEELRDEWNRKI